MDLYLAVGITYLAAAVTKYLVDGSVEHAVVDAYIGSCYVIAMVNGVH